MEHPRSCASCRRRQYGEDMVGPWCAGCFQRVVACDPLPHLAMRCERCDGLFWTKLGALICSACEVVPRRWRATLKKCRGCDWLYRPARNDKHRSCTPGCASRVLRDRRMAAAIRRGTHTPEQWAAKLAAYAFRCAYCGADGVLTKDHVRPISRGGSDAISNIVPACLPCNASKSNRALVDWLQRPVLEKV